MDDAQSPGTAKVDGAPENTEISPAPSRDAAPEAWHLPPPGIHVTGTQLRHRLITPESIAELETLPAQGMLGRILSGLRGK